MKILIYTGYYSHTWSPQLVTKTSGMGGSETCAVQLAEQLSCHKHDVHVYGNVMNVYWGGVQYIHFNNTSELYSHYDIVIAVNYIHYIKQLDGVCTWDRSLFWLHNFEPFTGWKGTYDFDGWEHEFHNPKMDYVVCVSQYQKKKIQRAYNIVDHRCIVIENAIDPTLFPNVTSKNPSMIWSSATDRGLDKVLELWPRIKKLVPTLTLDVCYPDYSIDYMKDIDLSQYEDVIDHGSLSKTELYELQSTSFLWFYPTDYEETFCITALEMMQQKVKIVTSATGNLTSLIDGNGTLLPADATDDDWLQAIFDAVDHNEDRDYLQHASVFVQFYTWKTRVHDWMKAFTDNKKLEQFNKDDNKMKVQKIYIITLVDTPETRSNWTETLNKAGLGSIQYEVWKGVNGANIDDDFLTDNAYTLYPDWKIEDSDNDWWNRELTPGEIGCAISHHQVWKQIVERGEENVLILEEDFKFNRRLTDEMMKTIPPDIDMAYFGRNAIRTITHSREILSEHWRIPSASYNMHAYMLTSKGATKLVAQNFNNNIMPVDEWIIGTYAAHDRNDLYFIKNNMGVVAIRDGNIFDQYSDVETSQTEHIHEMGNTGRLSPIGKKMTILKGKKMKILDFKDDLQKWEKCYLQPGVTSREWYVLCEEPIEGVLGLPFFTEQFCREISEIAKEANIWTTSRHESYPTTDVLLANIQCGEMYTYILHQYVYPMCKYMYELDGDGWSNMESETFLAKYNPDGQSFVGIHHDASDLTALVNLSIPDVDYTGGGTWFHKQKVLSKQPIGTMTIHPGNITHKHCSRPVLSGQRDIIVSFMTNRER